MEEIRRHYSDGGLADRIQAALDGVDATVTVDMLAPVDEFHIGGRAATAHLVEKLGLGSDDHVLDIGCGLGGTARFIASNIGARVTGVDLTPDYVEVAQSLTDAVGLGELVTCRVGTAIDLGSLGADFSAATLIHVGMNIADKQELARSVAGCLRPGAAFGIYDVMRTDSDVEVRYPVPWATTAATSHLATVQEYGDALETAGFDIALVEDRTEAGVAALERLAASSAGPSPIGLHLVMGPQAQVKVSNLRSALGSAALAPTMMIARRR